MNRDYFEMVRKAGAEPLAMGETGYRQISNCKRPLIQPDDLKGIKVRVVGSPMYGEIMNAHGREPDLHELGRRAAGAGLAARSMRRRTRSRSSSPPRSTRWARST